MCNSKQKILIQYSSAGTKINNHYTVSEQQANKFFTINFDSDYPKHVDDIDQAFDFKTELAARTFLGSRINGFNIFVVNIVNNIKKV